MTGDAAGPETRAVRIARRQRGIIGLSQLLCVGFSHDQVTHRVKTGWLMRLHEGVYSIGTVGAIGLIQAGLMASGPESMAGDHSSAALHDLLPYPAVVHVTVPRNGPRPPGLVVHRPKHPPTWTRRHGLRTMTVPETLLRLAAIDAALARQATDQALIDRRTSTTALTRFLDARGSRRGARALGQIIADPHTRSEAEKAFWRLIKAAKLPRPEVNVRVNGHLVDFFWPDYGLIVETDGWASHGRRAQWERDHARDLDHFSAGLTTVRITARQLEREPLAIAAALGAGLMRRRGASALPPATAAS